jgi:hypothetical protein
MNEHPIHQARISADYASKRNQAAHTIVQPRTPKRTEKKKELLSTKSCLHHQCTSGLHAAYFENEKCECSEPAYPRPAKYSFPMHTCGLKTSSSSVRELLVLSVLSLCTTAFYEPYPPFVLPPAIIHIQVCANSSCPPVRTLQTAAFLGCEEIGPSVQEAYCAPFTFAFTPKAHFNSPRTLCVS